MHGFHAPNSYIASQYKRHKATIGQSFAKARRRGRRTLARRGVPRGGGWKLAATPEPSAGAAPARLPAHFHLFAGVERVVHRAVDDVEDAARARHADGVALLEPVDRGNARLRSRQAAHNIDDFPAELLLPDLAQAGKSRFQEAGSRAFGHAPSRRVSGSAGAAIASRRIDWRSRLVVEHDRCGKTAAPAQQARW